MMRMMARMGALAAVVGAAAFVGCAHDTTVSEEKLGRLPVEEKQAIFTAQHNVTVAEANRASAERALEQARQFDEVAKNELDAAKNHVEAAREALDMGQRSGSEQGIRAAERKLDIGGKEVGAMQAKKEYANRLVDLRKQEHDLSATRVDAARAQLSFVQADALQRAGIPPDANMADVEAVRDDMNRKVAEQERKVAMLRDEVEGRKFAWEQRRRDFNLAQREMGETPPLREPPAPEPVQPERIPTPEELK